MTYDVNPSTHRFFQMFLLCSSSEKDRWGRPGDEDDSVSNSASDTTMHSLFLENRTNIRPKPPAETVFAFQNESGNIFQQDIFKLTREAVVISLPLAPFTEGIHVSRPLGEQKPARCDSGNTPGILTTNKLIVKCQLKEQLHALIGSSAQQTAQLGEATPSGSHRDEDDSSLLTSTNVCWLHSKLWSFTGISDQYFWMMLKEQSLCI